MSKDEDTLAIAEFIKGGDHAGRAIRLLEVVAVLAALATITTAAVNDNCIGTNWLALGQGLAPRAITTDGRGTGRADLFRNLASIALGTEFDIHFRVIDATTSAVVLASGCYQFTVSP
jgi:hypothetical protein